MNKYLYRHKYKNEPIQKNLIMFETFRGASYADSPKYIYEYLAKNFLDNMNLSGYLMTRRQNSHMVEQSLNV